MREKSSHHRNMHSLDNDGNNIYEIIYSIIHFQIFMNVTGYISYVDFQKRTCSQNKIIRNGDRLLTDIQPSGEKSEKYVS